MKFNTLHAIQNLSIKSGGPARSVTNLLNNYSKYNNSCLVTQSLKNADSIELKNYSVKQYIFENRNPFLLKIAFPVFGKIDNIIKNNSINIIHSHGLWLPFNHLVAKSALRTNTPLIIHPIGMLNNWAMNNKMIKKKIAFFLYQKRDINIASGFVATSESEYFFIRALGFKQPIAIIPNGIPLILSDPPKVLKLKGRLRVALFMGRIYPVKGLLNLINAWALLKPIGWILNIAGPNEAGHLEEVISLIKFHNLTDSIKYIGEVGEDSKNSVYQKSDLFILPSFSENFGLVIAEALSNGLPVITTKGTPWSDLPIYNCGWWIDIGVDPLVIALREATELSDMQRVHMGKSAKEYVKRFDWDNISFRIYKFQCWILGSRDISDDIYLN